MPGLYFGDSNIDIFYAWSEKFTTAIGQYESSQTGVAVLHSLLLFDDGKSMERTAAASFPTTLGPKKSF